MEVSTHGLNSIHIAGKQSILDTAEDLSKLKVLMSVFMFLNRDHFISVEFVLFVYLLVYLSCITQGRDFLVAVRLSFVQGACVQHVGSVF